MEITVRPLENNECYPFSMIGNSIIISMSFYVILLWVYCWIGNVWALMARFAEGLTGLYYVWSMVLMITLHSSTQKRDEIGS